jgi:hypothetical protein
MSQDHRSFRRLLPGFVIRAGTQVVLKLALVLADHAGAVSEDLRQAVRASLEHDARAMGPRAMLARSAVGQREDPS